MQFDGFTWLHSLSLEYRRFCESNRKEELSFLKDLLVYFGSPQQRPGILHIAGSKGKGSTALYLTGCLKRLGFRTITFTSPHVFNIKERVLSNGETLPDDLWHSLLEKIFIYHQQQNKIRMGYFDVLTLFAFLVYGHMQADYLVLETGIGGRLDTTNLCQPTATLITAIEKEHTQILGQTLAEIAREKAGILKQHIPVFVAPQPLEALAVLKMTAEDRGVPLLYLPSYTNAQVSNYVVYEDIYYQLCSFSTPTGKYHNVAMRMLGHKQCHNALLAWTCLRQIVGHNPRMLQAWTSCLAEDSIVGRFTVIQRDPLIVLDGCHTVESMALTVETWQQFTQGGTLIFTCKPDKNIHGMIPYFAHFDTLIITGSGQDLPAMFATVEQVYPRARFVPMEEAACKFAMTLEQPILVAGSFYSLAKMKNYLLPE